MDRAACARARSSTTGPRRARKFVKVFPNEYKRALAEISLKAMTALGEIRAGSAAEDAIAKAKGAAPKTTKVSAPK